jgi:hypothetical protein
MFDPDTHSFLHIKTVSVAAVSMGRVVRLVGEPRPHMGNDLEVGWNVLQNLGYVLAETT